MQVHLSSLKLMFICHFFSQCFHLHSVLHCFPRCFHLNSVLTHESLKAKGRVFFLLFSVFSKFITLDIAIEAIGVNSGELRGQLRTDSKHTFLCRKKERKRPRPGPGAQSVLRWSFSRNKLYNRRAKFLYSCRQGLPIRTSC